jgi:hypothetical protein
MGKPIEILAKITCRLIDNIKKPYSEALNRTTIAKRS